MRQRLWGTKKKFSSQFVEKKRENFFYTRFYYPYDRLNRPIVSRKLDFFFPFRKIKSSFSLSYLSATEVKVVRKSSFMIWITKIVCWNQFSDAPRKKRLKKKIKIKIIHVWSIGYRLMCTIYFLIVLSYEKKEISVPQSHFNCALLIKTMEEPCNEWRRTEGEGEREKGS